MRFVKKHSTIPIPYIYGYDSDADGRVGGKWVVMDYVGLEQIYVLLILNLKLIRLMVEMSTKSGVR